MKRFTIFLTLTFLVFLAACGSKGGVEDAATEELAALEVEFIVPETAEAGETVKLEAIVTYGKEIVEDADEVMFEYWVQGNKEDSTNVEGTHTSDGSYVAEVEFPNDGIYEMYAHTTARGLHTMPLKSITVGDAEEVVTLNDEHEHHEHADGFQLHFVDPELVKVSEETDSVVHLQQDNKPLENVTVRYEIVSSNEGNTKWIDAEESVAGEYIASYEFTEAGSYSIVIHVEDDADLHEHAEYTISVE